MLIVLGAAVAFFFWYRRRRALNNPIVTDAKPDVPAPALDVLNRPDPSEKLSSRPPTEIPSNVRVYSTHSDGTIDLDPESQRTSHRYQSPRISTQSNPFSDGGSIQTAGSSGTEGTNVIPIALVARQSMASSDNASSEHSATETTSFAPVRPPRSPELDLNDATADRMRLAYAQSQISGISGVSSRNSYISNMSYSSEFLNEAPVIVTQKQGVVRQVIGSVKAEMINAPGSGPSTPRSMDSLGPTSLASRPSVRSPLAATSFGPSDVLSERDEEQEIAMHGNPFGDEHSPVAGTQTNSPRSVTTFGTPGVSTNSSTPNSFLKEPQHPWTQTNDNSRPSSISTQAGSIIANIGSATRVNLGLGDLQSGTSLPNTPSTGGQYLRSPYRTTMGRLVTPPTGDTGTLEEQQQRALAHAQAQAQAQSSSRRVSGSSAISNTADSILESFPFVPPSPISNRPVRSPPRSPLNQRTFDEGSASSSIPQRPPPPPEPLLTEPQKNRRTLGLSTGSQLSTASSGLGSFPFHIESGPPAEEGKGRAPPSSFQSQGRQRASLDTLALTSDLSSYPLGYDRSERGDSYPPNYNNHP